mmetsp:Transcript_0/g.1  ORF Transcript_0/g.1 Transcript_0/m.1 type:complete len:182 (+) Transcript_0:196-741(+)
MMMAAHPPLPSPGAKRSASMMEGSPMSAKRSRMHGDRHDVENVWPAHTAGAVLEMGACGVQALHGCPMFMQGGQTGALGERQQARNHEHQHAVPGGDMEMEGACGHDGSCDVDMGADPEPLSRYARFPPPSQHSPTHYHKGTAVDYGAIPPMPMCNGDQQGADDAGARTWQCGYAGKSDYY